MTRIALYARFSSAENQRDDSIDQQLRLLRNRAAAEGWEIVGEYCDRGLSGSNMVRPALQQMLAAARERKFDTVLSESIDRLSRDQGDISHMRKRLQFQGISIFTLMEGEIDALKTGFKGTFSELYIADLAKRTHRGLEERALNGESAGGLAYGYRIEKRWDDRGKPIGGIHYIVEHEAEIIRRIFREYARGVSPRAIAFGLNAEGIPAQRGRAWRDTTILGSRQRRTGILNNERYIGKLTWNRQKFWVDPDSGRGNCRMKDESEWVRSEMPHLRIVDDELWNQVKARQGEITRRQSSRPNMRPRYLFSFLIKCGSCGSGMSKVSASQYGCGCARTKGTCDNRLTISRLKLEEVVLGALRDRLVDPELCKIFCQEYVAHINRLQSQQHETQSSSREELKRVDRDIAKLVEAIKRGVEADLIKDEINALALRKRHLESSIDEKPTAPVFVHPHMAQRYHQEVQRLIQSLNEPDFREESIELIRKLIDKIVLTPNRDRTSLVIDLHGNLAGILCVASGRAPVSMGDTSSLSLSEIAELDRVKLVANQAFLPVTGGVGLKSCAPPQPRSL
jgi:site-specific DNA recombinase